MVQYGPPRTRVRIDDLQTGERARAFGQALVPCRGLVPAHGHGVVHAANSLAKTRVQNSG